MPSVEITGLAAVVWLLVAVLTMGAAVAVAVLENLVHAAFCLLLVLLGVAGLYAFAGADLIAVLQVLLYVGGVVVLLLFAIMLTSRVGNPDAGVPAIHPALGAVAAAALGGLLAYALLVATRWPEVETAAAQPTTATIGEALLGEFLLPFEVASVLLLAAAVGAVVIARRDGRDAGGSSRSTP